MTKKGSSSTGLAIVMILIIVTVGFILASSKWKNTSSSSAAIQANGKKAVKCTLYSDGIYKNEYKSGDDKALPSNIASIAKSFDSTLCGSISSLGYVYYLSSVEDQKIIEAYKEELKKVDCTADDPLKGKENSSYSYNMHYTCKNGDGYVATDATRSTFYVGFNTSANPTAAASNSNANGNANDNANSNASNSNGNSNSNANLNSNSSNKNSNIR